MHIMLHSKLRSTITEPPKESEGYRFTERKMMSGKEKNDSATSADEAAKDIAEDTKHNDKKEENKADNQKSTRHDIFKELKVLKDSKSGSTSTCGSAANLLPPIPGLEIKGVGPIPLPITDFTAEKIKQVAHQAPHGRGMETIIDTSVRNTLQVDAPNITISNPAWSSGLRQVVSKVSESLGVESSMVRAELYKLLLYEPGGFFKKHRDTEKADGMFATLVIQLPSIFTGASFVVSHHGHSRTFELDKDGSAYEYKYVAHYADCEHEIKPVASGYRLALVYSLCYSGNTASKPSANDFGNTTQLREHLHNLDPAHSLFCVPLDHYYTTSSLVRFGVGALKGFDRIKYEAISDGGCNKRWQCVIALLEKCDNEYCSNDVHFDRCEETYPGVPTFENLFNVDGSDARFHKKWISDQLKVESLDNGGMVLLTSERDYAMEDYFWNYGLPGEVETTGNEGSSRQKTYHASALVFFTEESSFERMCQNNISDGVSSVLAENDLLPRFVTYLKEHDSSLPTKDCFRFLSHCIVKTMHRKQFVETLSTILSCHEQSSAPSSELTEYLIRSVHEYEGIKTEITDPIRSFLRNHMEICRDATPLTLLERVSFLLRIAKVIEDGTCSDVIYKSLKTFEQSTSNYSYSYEYFWQSPLASIADSIVALSEQHGWDAIKPVAHACFARMKKESFKEYAQEYELRKVIERAEVLYSICKKIPACNLGCHYEEIAEEFVVALESEKESYMNIPQVLVRCLVEYGSPNHLHRVDQWGSSTSASFIHRLLHSLGQIRGGKVERAKAPFVKVLRSHQKRMKIQQLNKLSAAAAKDRLHLSSWSMPHLSPNIHALKTFLHSSECGPKIIDLSCGISHAKYLEGWLNRIGTSAEIVETNSNGKNVSIKITKTKSYIESKVEKYQAKMKEIKKVQDDLRSLGVVFERSTNSIRTRSVDSSTADVHLTDTSASCQSSPRKKSRTKSSV